MVAMFPSNGVVHCTCGCTGCPYVCDGGTSNNVMHIYNTPAKEPPIFGDKPHELRQWRMPVGDPEPEGEKLPIIRRLRNRWREWAHTRRHTRFDRAPPMMALA